jgi:hypothetical protein
MICSWGFPAALRNMLTAATLLCVAAPIALKAQDTGTDAPPAVTTPAVPAQAAPATNPPAPVNVSPVVLEIVTAGCDTHDGHCRLRNTLVVTFKNLDQWRTDPKAKGNDPSQLLLVLNGRVMKGISATGPDTGQPNQLRFRLTRMDLLDGDQTSKDNRDAWSTLLSGSKREKRVAVGVSLGGNPPYIGTASIAFDVLPSTKETVAVAFFHIALLALFLLLAKNSDMLRDGATAGGAPAPWWKLGRRAAGAVPQTFSLARCQMAWWFFIVVSAYSFIWLVTSDTDTLTSGALILMGISAATGFSSFLIDSSKNDQRNTLLNEQQALNDRLAVLATDIAAVPPPANLTDLKTEQTQKTTRLAEVATELNSLPTPTGPSQGFLRDILSDESGVSFHRFQMAAWTVVLGAIFVNAVYRDLAMPDFSATMLGLMGISAGTYVGFKIPNPTK